MTSITIGEHVPNTPKIIIPGADLTHIKLLFTDKQQLIDRIDDEICYELLRDMIALRPHLREQQYIDNVTEIINFIREEYFDMIVSILNDTFRDNNYIPINFLCAELRDIDVFADRADIIKVAETLNMMYDDRKGQCNSCISAEIEKQEDVLKDHISAFLNFDTSLFI
jgi:hypothetical protein